MSVDRQASQIKKISYLRLALILTFAGMVMEFVGGSLSNSLALTSDAWHMFTHLFTLSLSYFAIALAMRPADKKRTYGFYRAEVLTAFINGILLLFVCGYIVHEAVRRFISAQGIRVHEMLAIAAIGLVINGISTTLLFRAGINDLNLKSAFLHEIGDMFSSIAVVASAVIIYYTGQYILDPIISAFICILIVIWAVKLLIESADILLESTPKHIDIDEITRSIKSEIADIHEVHHLHAWTIAPSIYALTAHVVIADCRISEANRVLELINQLMKVKFGISHTNIQFECLIK